MLRKLPALLLPLLLSCQVAFAWSKPDMDPVAARACIVMEMQTHRVLYQYNASEKLPMASTTKIMSAWLALEQPLLDEPFIVDTDAIHIEGSTMGLTEGDQVSLRALCYGMMLPSGNDAANAAAVHIAGSVENFVDMMNQRAYDIGLKNTHFVTPSGLDADEHYSTAYDMALLTANALENPDFAEICSTPKIQLRFGNPPFDRWLTNNNKLLTRCEGAIGVKTGFTGNARRCLVSACERNGITLICVTLNCGDDWNIHESLYNRYFDQLQNVSLDVTTDSFSVPVAGGNQSSVTCNLAQVPSLPLLPDELSRLKTVVTLKDFEYAPICKDQVLGSVSWLMDGEVVCEAPVVASQNVIALTQPESDLSFFQKLAALFSRKN